VKCRQRQNQMVSVIAQQFARLWKLMFYTRQQAIIDWKSN